MKNLLTALILSTALLACANNNTNAGSIDSNNEYKSNQIDSPNVGSRAYSGAEFPAENKLDPQ